MGKTYKKIDDFVKKALDLSTKGEGIIKKKLTPLEMQESQLKKLLNKAESTVIGKDYNFPTILSSENIIESFQNSVEIYDYNKIYQNYWYRQLQGESDVTWPGYTKYFALSSGTSDAASKYIPISNAILKSIKKASLKQMLTITKYDNIPSDFYKKGALMIGGSTHLNYNGKYYEGDLSGITASKIPFWFQHLYKPGKEISKSQDWDYKLKEIVKNAPNWNIGVIVGVPAWVQILLEKIIEEYKLNNIHEIWPDLNFYVHSGVAFSPYAKAFEKFFAHPIYYRESYLASEGYIACSLDPKSPEMQLILNNGIFYEFVPFNDNNFDQDGNIKPDAKAVWIKDVEENVNYAILLTTNAGSWRYLIGDTIEFVNKEKYEIKITGRTKHYLSIAGEHLSLDNISRAIELTQDELGITINEFTVFAEKSGTMFAHHWYVGVKEENLKTSEEQVASIIDKYLSVLNDDYRVERLEAIREINVDIISEKYFYNYLESKGKLGSANKFPRVLKGDRIKDWQNFLKEFKK